MRSARSRNRGEAWAYDLAQWRAYRCGQARSEGERAEIDREYERRLAEGPDFTHYHIGSDFRGAPVHKLDRNERIKVLTAFDVVRQGLYEHAPRRRRGKGGDVQQAAPVSRNYRAVLEILLSFAVKFGRVYPGMKTIARMACCSVRTVQNALAWLYLYGFVSRLRRIARRPGPLGPEVRQTSNAYALGYPTGLGKAAQSAFRRIWYGNSCRASHSTPQSIPIEPLGERVEEGFSV